MPKLIDYPRTSYTGAWEIAEITDDTGGKCSIETAARKLDRKVSGSFKAIIGSAVKFGLLTSKRDTLTTTTLFKRIKHAYDKEEELAFHREAFLTPPLFTQICRKFRSRELPIQMLDVMLIREFGVEEINAQGVAKAFVEGCRMVGLLDEHNIIADIDVLNAQKRPRRELASPQPILSTYQPEKPSQLSSIPVNTLSTDVNPDALTTPDSSSTVTNLFANPVSAARNTSAAQSGPKADDTDAIASLFGLLTTATSPQAYDANKTKPVQPAPAEPVPATNPPRQKEVIDVPLPATPLPTAAKASGYQIQITGPGVNTSLAITEEEDITLAIALLEKIRRQLRA